MSYTYKYSMYLLTWSRIKQIETTINPTLTFCHHYQDDRGCTCLWQKQQPMFRLQSFVCACLGTQEDCWQRSRRGSTTNHAYGRQGWRWRYFKRRTGPSKRKGCRTRSKTACCWSCTPQGYWSERLKRRCWGFTLSTGSRDSCQYSFWCSEALCRNEELWRGWQGWRRSDFPARDYCFTYWNASW